MIKDKHWTAFFSHTGSEIVNVANKIGRYPDVVITNKPPGSDAIHEGIRECVYAPKKPTVQDYRAMLDPDTVVTLHGWMRIVPPAICKEYEMYNLHPGLVTKYPELKGMDPQKRVFDNDYARNGGLKEYKTVGCVIHKVIPEVDDGLVLAECEIQNHFSGEKELSCRLHEMATELWVEVLTRNHEHH